MLAVRSNDLCARVQQSDNSKKTQPALVMAGHYLQVLVTAVR
jgi:hypothetical protein